MTSWSSGKYRLCKQSRRVSFHTRLDGIQLRAVRRQIVEHKIGGMFFSPLPMEPGVVVLGIVRDHHHAATAGEAGLVKLFHKFKEGQAVELLLLPAKTKAPIAKSYGGKIPHAVSRRMMPQHRILGSGGTHIRHREPCC